MDNNKSSLICLAGGWGLAALASGLAFVMLMLIGGWSIVQAIFAAMVIFIIVGALVSWIACRPLPAAGSMLHDTPKTQHPIPSSAQSAADAAAKAKTGASATAPSAATEQAAAASPAAAAAAAKSGLKPSKALAGEEELAARKGTWRYEGGDTPADNAKPAAAAKASTATAEPKPEAKAPAKEAPAKDAPAKAVPAEEAPAKAAAPKAEKATPAAASGDKDYDGDGVIEGKDEGARPATLDAARGGKADNLKEIKGIGPKLEILCNKLGFYHFDQIAGWSADEVAWVDANLEGFKGRVTRDEWVAQAKILAQGGETEFSKRVDDGDVY